MLHDQHVVIITNMLFDYLLWLSLTFLSTNLPRLICHNWFFWNDGYPRSDGGPARDYRPSAFADGEGRRRRPTGRRRKTKGDRLGRGCRVRWAAGTPWSLSVDMCVSTDMYVHTYVRMPIYMSVHMPVYTSIHMPTHDAHTHVHTDVHSHVHTLVHTHIGPLAITIWAITIQAIII